MNETRSGWLVAAGSHPGFLVCVLDATHRVHLVGPVPCATRCGVVVDDRARFRLSLRRTVYDREACPECWASFAADTIYPRVRL